MVATKQLSHTDAELAKQVQKLYGQGRTVTEIARKYGITAERVRHLRDAKLSSRSGNGKAASNGKPAAAKAAVAPPVNHVATVKAVELHRWLSDVKPFAGTDATMPMLTCVHVESDGKRLLAATTDRFTLGVSKLDIPEDGNTDVLTDIDFMLWPNDVDTLLRVSKTRRSDEAWRHVTIRKVSETPPGVTVPTVAYEFTFFSGETIKIKPADTEFPRFRQLIPESGHQIARAASGFTVDYLAKFAKVASDRGRVIRMYSHDDTPGGHKPVTVLIGDDFVGLIMPAKLHDEMQQGWVRPGWL